MFDPQTTPPEPVSLTWLPVDPEPADPPSTPDAPLTRAISFGPAMLRRLDQLGYCTLSDLAHANPNRLRADLGEISRLLDIDRWIDKARDALQHHTNPRAACAA